MKFVPVTVVPNLVKTLPHYQTNENRSIVVRDYPQNTVVTSTAIIKKDGVEELHYNFETMMCSYKEDVPQHTGSREFVPAGEILLIHYLDSVLGCKMAKGCILYSTPEGSFASDRYWTK